ncbi:hypothetical protein RvY_00322 [Ramazzottius varieornatus]|uniref:Uncharacterized protein n=1 Tax=Ramazzottius varieornatus TaxID=947166 RepID=A0A1D1UMV0_RAMVA|nr:hypothetical protein RvY_00322 [Ramazzottius varieornatus]
MGSAEELPMDATPGMGSPVSVTSRGEGAAATTTPERGQPGSSTSTASHNHHTRPWRITSTQAVREKPIGR